MTSKERIQAIFAGKTPDRIGRYEQTIYSSVGSAILGRQSLTGGTSVHFEEAKAWVAGGKAAHDEVLERVYADLGELRVKLKFDMAGIPWLHTARPTRRVGEYEFLYGDPDGEWATYRYDPESETYGESGSSRKTETIEDLKAHVREMERSLATATEPEGEPFYITYLKRLQSDFGGTMEVVGTAGLSIPLTESWLMATATDPGVVGAYLDAAVEAQTRDIRRQAKLGIKVLWAGGDLADNNGPVYGPKVFREIFLPRLKRLMTEVHRLGMYYLFRSDGNLWTVTDMIFNEAGVDAYGEIDWAAGMDLARLKPRYPRVTFWGNVPPPWVREKSRDEVLALCRHCIESVPDKRLILGASNAILPGTPVENVVAMTEAVLSHHQAAVLLVNRFVRSFCFAIWLCSSSLC